MFHIYKSELRFKIVINICPTILDIKPPRSGFGFNLLFFDNDL